LERRTISIEPELHEKILRFRAFFMSHRMDVDYTAAINFLAECGYDGLQKAGFSAELLARLDRKSSLDEVARDAMMADWLVGKMPGFPVGVKKLNTDGGEHADTSDTRKALPAQAQLEGVLGYCGKCKSLRQVKGPRLVTLKNGRKAIQGLCAACGSKVISFKIPR